ncbi:MAG: homoserine O-succinyltransferase [Rhodobacteraceae bacterium]|nr:homoserine O-succinyltransferase [Paracoccaceae bacterium]
MPIKLPSDLPAYRTLQNEGVMVMPEDKAVHQDIRPMRIGLLNLMPKKIQTETQFARLLGATPLQVELTLMRMTDHQPRNTSSEHIDSFYETFSEVAESGRKFDGMIITGAPVEQLDYEEVTYWDELAQVFDWTQDHVHSIFGVCWGAMAMINHFHGIDKHPLKKKAFGCFRHQNMAPASPYLQGFADDFVVPVSRWTEMRQDEIDRGEGLITLLGSDEVGPCLVQDPNHRALYIFNHLEYDSDTLKQEYDRDVAAGQDIEVPRNYYPDDDPTRPPLNRWRSHAHLLYGNWISELYLTTPFDITEIGVSSTDLRI